MPSLRPEVLRPPPFSDHLPEMRQRRRDPETDEAQFASLEDSEATETEEEPDGADLNGAALIEEIEGDEAEITDVIVDDEDDE